MIWWGLNFGDRSQGSKAALESRVIQLLLVLLSNRVARGEPHANMSGAALC